MYSLLRIFLKQKEDGQDGGDTVNMKGKGDVT